MEMVVNIRFDVHTGDDVIEQQILDISEEEGVKFAHALADRLRAEGIHDIRVRVHAE